MSSNGRTREFGSRYSGSSPDVPAKFAYSEKMLLIVRQKADEEILKKVAADLNGYVKVVVDVRRKILSAGGKMHVDGERLLLEDGCAQADVWGGGLDLEAGSE